MDIGLVLILAPVAVPLVLLTALATMLDGAAPFFCQSRLGRNGRIFRIVKIRTMVPDAEAKLAEHLAENPAAQAEWAHSQKLDNDPRITPLGRILRTTSLDEVPQLWNVLKGEMSMVGPRPMMVDQRALYPGQAYFSLRPGITGNWQVSDRGATGFADRARYDDAYVNALSLKTDLRILVRTVGVVLRCTGR